MAITLAPQYATGVSSLCSNELKRNFVKKERFVENSKERRNYGDDIITPNMQPASKPSLRVGPLFSPEAKKVGEGLSQFLFE